MRIGMEVLAMLAGPAAWPGQNAAADLARGVPHASGGADARDGAALLQGVCRARPGSPDAHCGQGPAQFHALLHRIRPPDAERDRAEVASRIQHAIGLRERALKPKQGDSETHALYGMRMARAPHMAVWRGRGARHHQAPALRTDPHTPRLFCPEGMSRLCAPAISDGRADALSRLRKAEALCGAERLRPAPLRKPAWECVQGLAFIAETYRAAGDRRRAEGYCRMPVVVSSKHPIAKEGWHACLPHTADKSR